jgi:Cytochrome c554 and c-prime
MALAKALGLGCLIAALASTVSGQAASSPTNPATAPPSSARQLQDGTAHRDGYVGDAACQACHREIVESYSHTAHHLTSRRADKDSIAGNFTPGANLLKTTNPDVVFRMESDQGGYFQTALEGQPPNQSSHRERFDLVIGSGRKGQTYLYWKGDELFQLPVSYWTELRQWVNSPGYRDGSVDFNRRVPPRCLECHATYFHSLAPPANRYDRREFTLGISCEKCHGPGREHVVRYTAKKAAAGASAIVNPGKLSRDRQVDQCALCHAGPGEPAPAPAFSFVPGDKIDDYLNLEPLDPNAALDVHGSQVELLGRSRCFRSSTMTCSTCHDIHRVERDAAAFSRHCLGCHKVENCGLYPSHGKELAKNCVDCHMPNQATALIVSSWNGRMVRPRIRNHWIKVYSETTR